MASGMRWYHHVTWGDDGCRQLTATDGTSSSCGSAKQRMEAVLSPCCLSYMLQRTKTVQHKFHALIPSNPLPPPRHTRPTQAMALQDGPLPDGAAEGDEYGRRTKRGASRKGRKGRKGQDTDSDSDYESERDCNAASQGVEDMSDESDDDLAAYMRKRRRQRAASVAARRAAAAAATHDAQAASASMPAVDKDCGPVPSASPDAGPAAVAGAGWSFACQVASAESSDSPTGPAEAAAVVPSFIDAPACMALPPLPVPPPYLDGLEPATSGTSDLPLPTAAHVPHELQLPDCPLLGDAVDDFESPAGAATPVPPCQLVAAVPVVRAPRRMASAKGQPILPPLSSATAAWHPAAPVHASRRMAKPLGTSVMAACKPEHLHALDGQECAGPYWHGPAGPLPPLPHLPPMPYPGAAPPRCYCCPPLPPPVHYGPGRYAYPPPPHHCLPHHPPGCGADMPWCGPEGCAPPMGIPYWGAGARPDGYPTHVWQLVPCAPMHGPAGSRCASPCSPRLRMHPHAPLPPMPPSWAEPYEVVSSVAEATSSTGTALQAGSAGGFASDAFQQQPFKHEQEQHSPRTSLLPLARHATALPEAPGACWPAPHAPMHACGSAASMAAAAEGPLDSLIAVAPEAWPFGQPPAVLGGGVQQAELAEPQPESVLDTLMEDIDPCSAFLTLEEPASGAGEPWAVAGGEMEVCRAGGAVAPETASTGSAPAPKGAEAAGVPAAGGENNLDNELAAAWESFVDCGF